MKEKSKSQAVQRDGGQCEPSCRRLNSALEKAGVATCPVPADIPGMRLQHVTVKAGKRLRRRRRSGFYVRLQ